MVGLYDYGKEKDRKLLGVYLSALRLKKKITKQFLNVKGINVYTCNMIEKGQQVPLHKFESYCECLGVVVAMKLDISIKAKEEQ
jgi:hypothetical protein